MAVSCALLMTVANAYKIPQGRVRFTSPALLLDGFLKSPLSQPSLHLILVNHVVCFPTENLWQMSAVAFPTGHQNRLGFYLSDRSHFFVP